MKNLIIFVSLILFTRSAFAVPGTAAIGAIKTNPSANLVMTSTSALNSGGPNGSANWQIQITYSCTVAATYEFQVMNGSTAVSSLYLLCPAGITQTLTVPGISFPIAQGYTLQVINVSAFTGSGQATIFYALESVN